MSSDSASLAAMSSKGQIVISSSIRKKLELRKGQRFVERVEGGKVILEPLQTPIELRGMLKGMSDGKTTEEMVREVKEGWR